MRKFIWRYRPDMISSRALRSLMLRRSKSMMFSSMDSSVGHIKHLFVNYLEQFVYTSSLMPTIVIIEIAVVRIGLVLIRWHGRSVADVQR